MQRNHLLANLIVPADWLLFPFATLTPQGDQQRHVLRCMLQKRSCDTVSRSTLQEGAGQHDEFARSSAPQFPKPETMLGSFS